MHRTLTIALAGLTLLALSGCPGKTGEAAKTAAKTGAAKTGAAEAPAGGLTTVKVTLEKSKTEAYYSFESKDWVADKGKAELTVFYDTNDCKRGAVIGCDDKNRLHIVGKKSTEEIAGLGAPPKSSWVPGLRPLDDKAAKGTAFYVKRPGDKGFAVVRLSSVTDTDYEKLQGGAKAELTFEWKLVE